MKLKHVSLIAIFAIISLLLAGCTTQPTDTQPSEVSQPAQEQKESEPAEAELDSNCDALPDKLETCEIYKCQFIHPFTGEDMVKEIKGIEDGKCVYIEEMPNDGQMECGYTESMRNAVAQYYRDVAEAESVGTSVTIGSDSEVTYTIDGKEVENPLQEAMNTGQCIISGYDKPEEEVSPVEEPNDTIETEHGCAYDNPSCDEDYDCIDNECVLKEGCQYDNPPCDSNEECIDNQCIKTSLCEIPSSLSKSQDTIEGEYYDVYTEPGSSFRVVCQQPCPIDEDILKAKYAGAKKAIGKLIELTGVDVDDSQKPVDIHLNGDDECGSAEKVLESWGISGFAARRVDGRGYICLFDLEKTNRILEFNEENACKLEDQTLLVHEYGHELFYARAFASPESFVKAMSFYVSGFWDGNGYESENFIKITNACNERLNYWGNDLVYLLCKNHGFQFSDFKPMMTEIVDIYESGEGEVLDGEVSDSQFKEIIDEIVGEDTEATFIEAGWTPEE